MSRRAFHGVAVDAVQPDGTLSFSTAAQQPAPAIRHLDAAWRKQCLLATGVEARAQVTYPLTSQRWSSMDSNGFAGGPA